MIYKRKRNLVAAVVLVYLVYLFVSTIRLPQHQTVTEHQSSKLEEAVDTEKNSNYLKIGTGLHPNVKLKLEDTSTMRQQLSFQYPYDSKKPFPKRIWQTWKVKLESELFPANYKKYHRQWVLLNPDYYVNVVSDDECAELVATLYRGVPDVARAYSIMPKLILKADFFRYLILFARGGVYSDIDTQGLKPVADWVSMNKTIYGDPNKVGLVVGIEADPDRPDWADWYARRIQFCQWTMQAKVGHPMLRELIANITDQTLIREKNHELTKVLGKDEGGDIMNWTGPGIWTDKIFEYMNNVMQQPDNFKTRKYDEVITWKMFTGTQKPVVVSDVLVLPITSFSPGVGQMGAGHISHPMAYSQHMFLGSWKPPSER